MRATLRATAPTPPLGKKKCNKREIRGLAMRFAELLLASRRDAPPPHFGSCASSPAPATPAPARNSATTSGSPNGWPSGRRELKLAKYHVSRWPDGQKVGRGHGQPYLMAKYAKAVAKGEKTVEGRPGGGWLGKGIAPDDYISFKIPGQKSRALIVRACPTPPRMPAFL